jgi:RND family efflux transporter MFP subunit
VQPAGTPLVTITQLDPIAVSFTLPQRNLADALAGLRAGDVAVQAQLPDGQTPLEGRLQFVDNTVDAASGSVKVKAVFRNDRLLLWPGAYVNVQLRVSTLKDAIAVPQAAIVQGATARTVFVVGADGKAAERRVEVVASGGNQAVVSGVEAGERVVVEGRQNLRPGSPVRERPADASAGSHAPGGRGGGASAAGAGQASAPQP